ncbi:hypothetical protein NEMIN01_0149 [Nematocida minor]|uniref:uncharacterized protein n=1 Tax=Nematocida minor TaxID=1912983 RepID=UPI0022210F6A|nr:uncharacterized protein NEMIN01_0045 [Nematocida minor]XP_051332051.1 uncharacterized protein NEMIN01_0149 [Nematocida minor]KAI5188781.1 hypothetical protein NEMIN01_0045 [Nematocida minor]KAI5188885.1 hypothetical protein NEMIN01_0149 [Nematocida minor]
MDYERCREILDEDSDEGGHPNIDDRTFKKWKQERKEEIRQQLGQRLQAIEGEEECTEEAKKIKDLLKEKIVDRGTYTKVSATSSVFEIVAIETEDPRIQRIVETICESNSVIDYIAVIKEVLGTEKTEEMAERIEEYLLTGIKYNIEEKYYAASQRMAQCIMALEYVKIESGPITGHILEGICREGAAYHQRILDYYRTNSK